MGQVLQNDKIGNLSEALGVITLASSRLTLGGQQFVTNSLQVTLTGLSANTLYFLYVRLNSGIPVLEFNTTVNSIYTISQPTAKLVGSFYSNGVTPVAFGSFVTIEGVPTSDYFEGGKVPIVTGLTPVTKPGSPDIDRTIVKRVGDLLFYQFQYRHIGGGGNAAAGIYAVRPQSAFPHDNVNGIQFSVTSIIGTQNGAHISTAVDGRDCGLGWGGVSSNGWQFNYADGTNISATDVTHPFTSNWLASGSVTYKILGLTSTPLKDL